MLTALYIGKTWDMSAVIQFRSVGGVYSSNLYRLNLRLEVGKDFSINISAAYKKFIHKNIQGR